MGQQRQKISAELSRKQSGLHLLQWLALFLHDLDFKQIYVWLDHLIVNCCTLLFKFDNNTTNNTMSTATTAMFFSVMPNVATTTTTKMLL